MTNTRESLTGSLADSDAVTVVDEWNTLYFAFVMATGIVSIATHELGFTRIGWGLFGLNVVAYLLISGLTLARIGHIPSVALHDLQSYDRGMVSFTMIAGTCVLGSQFVIFGVSTTVATGLLVVGSLLWVLLIYRVFFALTITTTDEPIAHGIDGSWFLVVVATQSVAVLAGLLAPLSQSTESLLLVAVGLYSIGGMFYLILITLVFYRMTFYAFDPRSATPPYWINMGAVAITTLAGAILLETTDQWLFLADIEPFLTGFTFFFWATATWWIPLLIILGVWRHTVGGIALPHTLEGYRPRYWGMVFPLGMYTESSLRLGTVTDLTVLTDIPELFVYVALIAWVGVSVGLVRRLVDIV
ncbi:tellurite resistance/C4-dicarboxylate transporter family protein [Halohasta litchfieldiae]|nr:tellurite resistance/C4-dicarboxylate transporter family protein [Halohasta litchfieldiae]